MKGGIFLDRDGVINEVLSSRVKFVNKPSDFYLLDGVGEAIRLFNDKGLKVFVVTNQGGVGLGYMTEIALNKIHEKMEVNLAVFQASITEVAYCAHTPNAGCNCRKPEAEMFFRLAEKHNIDLQESYMVGDRKVDIEAGKKAGTKTVLVGSRAEKADADLVLPDLLAFAHWLL